ncbi:MAG: nucleoside hydrolase [Anaerolineae bacterium]
MTNRVWLDTDIGTDVDDIVALSLALLSPEIDLVGVSAVYGDVALRSRMIRKVLSLAGRAEVPVHAGCTHPVMNERPIYWAGWEGEGLLGPEDAGLAADSVHAVDAMTAAVNASPGEIDVVAVGPLTNVAVALMRDMTLAQRVRRFVIMGGLHRTGQDALSLRFAEHNITCDPEAASVVFRCGAPIVMVGLDVTLRVQVTADDVEVIAAAGDPLRLALADQLRRYLRANQRHFTHMHDPLAMSYVVRPSLLALEPCEVLVDTRSEIAAGATWVRYSRDSRTQVAVDVDTQGFERFLVERLSAPRT